MAKNNGYSDVQIAITLAAWGVAVAFGLAALAVLVGTLASHLGGGLGGGAMALAIVAAFTVLVAYVIASRPNTPAPASPALAAYPRTADEVPLAS